MMSALLAGCGGAQKASAPARDMVGPADPLLAPALAGEQPRALTDPSGVARQITVAETAVRDRAISPELAAAAGRTAQVAYLALLDRPDWDAAVLADVPAPLQDPVRRNVAAGRELQAMASRLPTTM